MVFFRRRMKRVIQVHPQHLGPKIKEQIKEQCRLEVQGEKNVSGVGFIVLVINIEDEQIGKGTIDHLTGKTRYEVEYDAIVFRPFKNEVLDVIIKKCTPQGMFADAGPLDIFISRMYIPGDYEYRGDDSTWIQPHTETIIRPGSEIRVKVLGANSVGHIAAVATMNEPFLGPL